MPFVCTEILDYVLDLALEILKIFWRQLENFDPDWRGIDSNELSLAFRMDSVLWFIPRLSIQGLSVA